MSAPNHRRALGLLIGAAVAWSLGGLLIKNIDWPPLAVAGGRGAIAAIFLLVTNRGLRFRWDITQIGAGFAYAGCTVCFVIANKLTTAANAILLQYTAPVWVALLAAWLLHERIDRRDWLTIGAVLGGLALFLADGLQFGTLPGNAVALLSGGFFALMIVLLRRQNERPPIESIILGNIIAALIGLPAMLDAPPLELGGWVSLGVLGAVQLGFSYWLYARAMRHVTSMEAVLVPMVEPLLNPLWVLLIHHEKPSGYAILGGLVVMAAILWRSWPPRRPAIKPSIPS